MQGSSDSTSDQHVVIVGGGIAGLAAAMQLAQAGLPITLVETRQRLGGRATSFTDPTTGETLDNCQHVLMRCCTYLCDFYRRLDTLDAIEWHDRFYFADGSGKVDILAADPLPAPMHMTRRLLGFRTLGWADKLAIARGMWAIMRTGHIGRNKLADIPFADWLKKYRQTDRAIRRFWSPVIVSACNATIEDVPTHYALQVFQEGFLASRQGYEMGLSRVPLVQLYDRAQEVIAQAGGKVMLSTSAQGFVFEDGRVTGLTLGNGEVLNARWFISSVPFDRLAKLSTDAMRAADDRLKPLDTLDVNPIIGIHLFFALPDAATPPMTLPHIALMDSPIDWLFNKGVETDAESGKPVQHVHGVISAANELSREPAEKLIEMAAGEVRRMVPGMKDAALVHGRAVKEKRATFALRAGVDACRADAQAEQGIANLLLAGDWCNSGWPATMEGATRTGYYAAAAVLTQAGMHDAARTCHIDEWPSDWLYRLLAGR